MPRSKRHIENKLEIDGAQLIWTLHREQQFCTDGGWKGLAIHVRNAVGVHRELHMEYPAVKTQKADLLRMDRVVVNIRHSKVEEHIRRAMEWGWDPASRGKPYIYEVDELPY